MKTKKWSVTDVSRAKYIGLIEFQDEKGQWHNFEVMATKERVVFGGACNVGFMESGYIERDDCECLDETLQEMLSDLEMYYNGGPEHVSRIVCNERM